MKLPLSLWPHHDGSALYVSPQTPVLEGRVKLKIRIHQSMGEIERVSIRQSDSGEGFLSAPLRLLHTRHGWDWYEGSLIMFNPEVHYRFLIEISSTESFWLNGVGLFELDQPDRDDFKINTYRRPPSWASGAVMYQVFPDRFA
ncbi:MAG: hypothetical protein RL696_396, partial [Actinomycetota bacterium]